MLIKVFSSPEASEGLHNSTAPASTFSVRQHGPTLYSVVRQCGKGTWYHAACLRHWTCGGAGNPAVSGRSPLSSEDHSTHYLTFKPNRWCIASASYCVMDHSTHPPHLWPQASHCPQAQKEGSWLHLPQDLLVTAAPTSSHEEQA